MQRTSSLALASLLLVLHTTAVHAGGARARKPSSRRGDAPTNAPVFRDFDRTMKSAAAGTPLSRAFRVPRAKGKAGGRAYTVKAEDATLVERTRSGARAVVQLEQSRRGRAVKSATLRVPSRTRRGSELTVRNGEGRIQVSLRDPERGEVWGVLTLGPKAPAEVAVTYYTLPPGESMRTRPPVSPAEAAAFIAGMGGFHPARGTRASRGVADFTRRLKTTVATLRPEEQEQLAPLLALLTPSQTRAPSLAPERTPRQPTAKKRKLGPEDIPYGVKPRPNAPIFADARISLRLAAQGTPLARQEKVPARRGQRAYTVDARTANLRQDGVHGRSTLHIENNWGKGFRPRAARVSVPGTGKRGARLELTYTPHKMRIALSDGRRGRLEIALDNDVDQPGGVRYSIVDLAGSGQSAPVSPAEAMEFVRDIGGFQPAPGTRAGVAVADLANRLDARARRSRTAGAELAPLIAALGGPR